jgi:CRISPR-associated endonuclease/helicase Cas3
VNTTQVTEGHLLLWGKTCRREDDRQNFASRYHPLLFHLLDVAHTARELWDMVLPEAFKKRIAAALQCDLESARMTVAFLAGVHDLGKATPGFQFREDTPLWLRERLKQHGFSDPPRRENKPHGLVTAKELCLFLRAPQSFWQNDKHSNRVMAHITGAHHGTFPSSEYGSWAEKEVGDAKWGEARLALLHYLRAELCPEFAFPVISWREDAIGAVPQLAGFISVADWIGSSRLFEPAGHRDGTRPLHDYIQESQSRARRSLRDFGWAKTPQPRDARPDFAEFWGFPPNALQEAIIKQTRDVTTPFFLLIEAPMGAGKTEAALWASDAAQSAGVNGGFYIALPTQATSNAMYKRVKKFLSKRYRDERAVHLQLVHSHAALSDEVNVVFKGLIYDAECTPEEASVVAASWFCGAKRTLLAPFGVGTIDQSLLAALQARHWFVRMFGLSGKVVVFDEVHAYDTYMSHLLATLLGWLREIGCSVIMLSATLPTSRRSELTRAWGGELPSEEALYPRLTWLQCDQRTATSHAIEARDLETETDAVRRLMKEKTVAVRHLRPEVLGQVLREKLQGGGCAAIICNTVVEAQQMFERLRAEVGDIVPEDGWTLFHARMPFGWRQRIEKSVIKRFGKKKAERPRCSVVVATQVIEQSLDLDFDWMASFMSPGDLLLQRMGRLHRHPQDENDQPTKRPDLLDAPELALLCDAIGDEVPSFGLSELVYEREVLLRSWLVWRNRIEVHLPDDIEPLVEAVYTDKQRIPDAAWQNEYGKALQAAEQKRCKAKETAKNVVVSARNDNGRPQDPATFVDFPTVPLRDDDDPEVNKQLCAATRDGDPSVTVVCLCRHNNRIYLFNDKGEMDTTEPPLDLNAEPTPDLTRKLVDLSLSLSNRALFAALSQDKTPAGWKKSPMLRHYRALIFDGNLTKVSGRRLRLDRELGLVIEKEEMEKEAAEP